MLFEIISVQSAPSTNGSLLLQYSQVGDVVVANQDIFQTVFRNFCLHCFDLIFESICHTKVPIGVVVV